MDENNIDWARSPDYTVKTVVTFGEEPVVVIERSPMYTMIDLVEELWHKYPNLRFLQVVDLINLGYYATDEEVLARIEDLLKPSA